MKILIVSPHCDDAAFSLTEHILTWVEDGHDVEIYTVYGGMPTDAKGREKHRRLDEEHRKAVAALGVTASRSQYLDDAYPNHQPTVDMVRESVIWAAFRADCVVYPRGIGHPDHIIVGWACQTMRLPLAKRLVYDEIPYYVRSPRDAFAQPEDRDNFVFPTGCRQNLARKKEICKMYGSQLNEDLLRCLWVPERCWGEL